MATCMSQDKDKPVVRKLTLLPSSSQGKENGCVPQRDVIKRSAKTLMKPVSSISRQSGSGDKSIPAG